MSRKFFNLHFQTNCNYTLIHFNIICLVDASLDSIKWLTVSNYGALIGASGTTYDSICLVNATTLYNDTAQSSQSVFLYVYPWKVCERSISHVRKAENRKETKALAGICVKPVVDEAEQKRLGSCWFSVLTQKIAGEVMVQRLIASSINGEISLARGRVYINESLSRCWIEDQLKNQPLIQWPQNFKYIIPNNILLIRETLSPHRDANLRESCIIAVGEIHRL